MSEKSRRTRKASLSSTPSNPIGLRTRRRSSLGPSPSEVRHLASVAFELDETNPQTPPKTPTRSDPATPPQEVFISPPLSPIPELSELKRKQIQSIAKKIGIKANQATDDMVSQLNWMVNHGEVARHNVNKRMHEGTGRDLFQAAERREKPRKFNVNIYSPTKDSSRSSATHAASPSRILKSPAGKPRMQDAGGVPQNTGAKLGVVHRQFITIVKIVRGSVSDMAYQIEARLAPRTSLVPWKGSSVPIPCSSPQQLLHMFSIESETTGGGLELTLDYLVPDDILEVERIFKSIVAEGMTYPQYGEMSHEQFKAYYLAGETFVAKTPDGSVAGAYYVKPNYPGRCSHICNGVNAAFRNKGVGKFLARTFVQIAPQLGYRASVFNLVFASNIASVKLWDDLGFTRVGTIPKAGLLADGKYHDAYVYHYEFSQ